MMIDNSATTIRNEWIGQLGQSTCATVAGTKRAHVGAK